VLRDRDIRCAWIAEEKDTTILLFSLVMGMACGIGMLVVAWMGTLILLMVMVLLHWGHGRIRQTESENTNLISIDKESTMCSEINTVDVLRFFSIY